MEEGLGNMESSSSPAWAAFFASSMELVHRRFEKQVEQSPDSIAVISGDEHISYAELNNRANRLARMLLKAGVDGRGSKYVPTFKFLD